MTGNEIKALESQTTSMKLDPYAGPIIARLDGRAFHSFTKGLKAPFDERLSTAMINTAKYLVEKTDALIAYTQSDEITLVFEYKYPSQPIFGGKLFKMQSLFASMATAYFCQQIHEKLPERRSKHPHFDCRVFSVPDRKTAAEVVNWRVRDARKNAISSAARSVYSHKECENKSGEEKLAMLRDKGVRFIQYPGYFTSGTFVWKEVEYAPLDDEVLEHIPEEHRPIGLVTRNVMMTCSGDDERNLKEFIFGDK